MKFYRIQNSFALIKSLLLFCLLSSPLFASQTIRTSYASDLLKCRVGYIVVLPDKYIQDSKAGIRYPVLYMLHCAGGDTAYYLRDGCGKVESLIDSFRMILVLPDDSYGNNWWLDSPLRTSSLFSSFISKELKSVIDSHYVTYKDKGNTGIAGHSMGGFGALHNMLEHPEIYGSAVSIKGALDLRIPLNPNWNGNDFGLFPILGNQVADSSNWIRCNLLQRADQFARVKPRIRLYNGLNDTWFSSENKLFHQQLTDFKINHEFIETTEDHFGIPTPQMKEILKFFDTTFTRDKMLIKKPAKKNTLSKRPVVGKQGMKIPHTQWQLSFSGENAPGKALNLKGRSFDASNK